jgi:3-hydroxybutyryl-CoA dehydrogenase
MLDKLKANDRLGIAGGGSIGSSVALDLALKGFDVVLNEVNEQALEKAKDLILRDYRLVQLMMKYEVPDLDVVMGRINGSLSKEDFSGCPFVIENITEDWEAKKSLYAELDECCPDAIIAANTSCIPITRLASLLSNPGRMIGIHFMNPVPFKPTVEVIRGNATDNRTFDAATSLLKRMEKTWVVVGDAPGFVSNRLSHLFMNEAACLVQEKVSNPEDIDTIFKKCYEHRMGPLETADLIGIDTVVRSLEILYRELGDDKFLCCELLRTMVTQGKLGRKTGQGFYKY